jgi:hypothetical protein
MIFFKKMLILMLVIAAMYLAYIVVNFLKSKINVGGNMGAFLLLLLLSFGSILLIIVTLGFLLIRWKDFFFKQ